MHARLASTGKGGSGGRGSGSPSGMATAVGDRRAHFVQAQPRCNGLIQRRPSFPWCRSRRWGTWSAWGRGIGVVASGRRPPRHWAQRSGHHPAPATTVPSSSSARVIMSSASMRSAWPTSRSPRAGSSPPSCAAMSASRLHRCSRSLARAAPTARGRGRSLFTTLVTRRRGRDLLLVLRPGRGRRRFLPRPQCMAPTTARSAVPAHTWNVSPHRHVVVGRNVLLPDRAIR